MKGSTQGSTAGPWVPMLLAAVVHHGVLSDHFKHDDFIHLFQIANHGFAEFLLIPHGGHLLSTSNLVFYLCYQLFGIEAVAYQAVALATHLLNVWLLYGVVERLTGRQGIAFFGSALWGMAPVAGGSIGWFSVYGHLLATTFILWVLRDMAARRDGSEPIPGGVLLRWYALLLAAGTSFGVGLGVAAVFGGVAWALLPGAPNRTRVAGVLGSLLAILPLLFVLQHEVYDALWGPLVADGRNAVQHLARFGDLLSMWWRLLCFASAAVLLGLAVRTDHGRFPVEPLDDLQQELSWLIDGVGVALLVMVCWVAWRSDRRERWLIAGLALIALAAYAVIAAGRLGLMAHAPSVLWMVSSPRYHYLGTLGIALTVCAALAVALRQFTGFDRWAQTWGRWVMATWILAALPFDLHTAGLVATRDGLAARAVHDNLVASVREAVEKKPIGAPVFIDNAPFTPVRMVVQKHFPGNAAVFVLSFPDNTVDGREVYFVEVRSSYHGAANRRPDSRISRLLVTKREQRELRRVWRLKRDGK